MKDLLRKGGKLLLCKGYDLITGHKSYYPLFYWQDSESAKVLGGRNSASCKRFFAVSKHLKKVDSIFLRKIKSSAIVLFLSYLIGDGFQSE